MSSLATAGAPRADYQLEALAAEFDASGMLLDAPGRSPFPLAEALTDGTLERTVEGASTLTLTVRDRDRLLWRSGTLVRGATVEVDGLRFVLVSVEKRNHDFVLTFEDFVVWLLRSYPRAGEPHNGFRVANATKTKRVEFAQRLIEDVKERRIDFIAQGLIVSKPVTSKSARQPDRDAKKERQPGFAPNIRLTVKSSPASPEQVANAGIILDVGRSLNVSRAELVISIMVAIQESTLRNLPMGKPGDYNYLSKDPNKNPVGVFQQIKAYGWPASRDVATDAHAFFAGAGGNQGLHSIWLGSSTHPTTSDAYGRAGDLVQGSGNPHAYEPWRTEAERFVTSYGVGGGDAADDKQTLLDNLTLPPADDPSDTTNMFVRGSVVTKNGRKFFVREDNWKCLGRLADEVNWRRYAVSGAVYFISEPYLFQSAPRMRISEASEGVDWINGKYDAGQRNATLTVECRLDLWEAPPGSTVEIFSESVFSGRWLVATIRRGLFSSAATITLKKPRPVLPESQAPEHPQTDQTPTFKLLPRVRPDKTETPPALPGGSSSTPALPASSSLRSYATTILGYIDRGLYRDDNGQQRVQWEKVARGEQLTGNILRGPACSTGPVTLDERIPAVLIMLVDQGYTIGSFAICEDHHCNDGQHPKGQAIDISSLGRAGDTLHALSEAPTFSLQLLVIDVMKLLQPYAWDLICAGIGGVEIPAIETQQLDNRVQRSGEWVTGHRSHIHFGVVPGKRDEP